MKWSLPLALLLLLVLPVSAQNPKTPAAAAPPLQTLPLEPGERQFFALGLTLARGAFAYAELAQAAEEVAKTHSKIAQVGKLGTLAPLAERDRRTAGDETARAAGLMRSLGAPPAALAPVAQAAQRLAGTLPITNEARPLLLFNRKAARTVSALNEFETLSSLPEDPAIRKWMDAPGFPPSALVWYGEGKIAGLAQIVAAHEMLELLPSPQQITTHLCSLRDWLALRLPDMPTPEQAALKNALEGFLWETERLGGGSQKGLTPAQLQALGEISRRLQTQVLGPEGKT